MSVIRRTRGITLFILVRPERSLTLVESKDNWNKRVEISGEEVEGH